MINDFVNILSRTSVISNFPTQFRWDQFLYCTYVILLKNQPIRAWIYLLADGRQPVEAITGRFEANDTFAGATETGVVHAYRGAPRWQWLFARAACGGGAPRGGQRRAAATTTARARWRHDQRHLRWGSFFHASRVPILSPEPTVMIRVLTVVRYTFRRPLEYMECCSLNSWIFYVQYFSWLELFCSNVMWSTLMYVNFSITNIDGYVYYGMVLKKWTHLLWWEQDTNSKDNHIIALREHCLEFSFRSWWVTLTPAIGHKAASDLKHRTRPRLIQRGMSMGGPSFSSLYTLFKTFYGKDEAFLGKVANLKDLLLSKIANNELDKPFCYIMLLFIKRIRWFHILNGERSHLGKTRKLEKVSIDKRNSVKVAAIVNKLIQSSIDWVKNTDSKMLIFLWTTSKYYG